MIRAEPSSAITQPEAEAAAQAIAQGRGTPDHYVCIGWYQQQQGDWHGAAALFMEATERDPAHVLAHVSLAAILRSQGQLAQAVRHCDIAIAAAPDLTDAWFERAQVMIDGGDARNAEQCLRAVLSREADHAGAHGALARLAARRGDSTAAHMHAHAARATDPANATAAAALAIVALDRGDPAAAQAALHPALAPCVHPSPERASLAVLLGEACDALDDTAAAERWYALANADFLAGHTGSHGDRIPMWHVVERLADDVAAAGTAQGNAPPAQPRAHGTGPQHVFVLGHPRSGNTLVENILAALPGVSAIEESPTLRPALREFSDLDGLRRLHALDDSALAAYRSDYWQRVRQAGGDPDAPVVVDMDPLKSLALPVIARLFPEARILRVLRDPRDVVWSCYRTSFALSNASLDFATLDGAARHFAATMRLIETVRSQSAMAIMDVRYEDLVSDFDTATRAITTLLGVTGTPDLRRFDAVAKARGVTTASERQVRKGLFDGRRQWERHAACMAPVLDILAPWLTRYGYAP